MRNEKLVMTHPMFCLPTVSYFPVASSKLFRCFTLPWKPVDSATLSHIKTGFTFVPREEQFRLVQTMAERARATQLIEFEGDNKYYSAIARNVEARKLIETGFECVCDHENVILFRKRKYRACNCGKKRFGEWELRHG